MDLSQVTYGWHIGNVEPRLHDGKEDEGMEGPITQLWLMDKDWKVRSITKGVPLCTLPHGSPKSHLLSINGIWLYIGDRLHT